MTVGGVPAGAVRTIIPACAGMTVGGVPAGAVRTIIPACAAMTVGGVPAGAVRTIIPACAGMTGNTRDAALRHSQPSCALDNRRRESGNHEELVVVLRRRYEQGAESIRDVRPFEHRLALRGAQRLLSASHAFVRALRASTRATAAAMSARRCSTVRVLSDSAASIFPACSRRCGAASSADSRARRRSNRRRANGARCASHCSAVAGPVRAGTMEMQSTGHGSTHRPQPVHSLSSTACIHLRAPMIASTGQARMHTVHPMHALSSMRAVSRGCAAPQAGSSGTTARASTRASAATVVSPPGGQRLISASPRTRASAYGRHAS